MEVVAHGVCHGATRALTMAHPCLQHKMDLRRMAPRFSAAEEIPDDFDVRWLFTKFSGNTEVIAIIIDVERIIKDTPF